MPSATPPGRLALSPDEAHLWYVLADEAGEPPLLAAYHDLMSAEERARHAALRVPGSRIEHLLARALVRATLSRYADVAPEAWAFRRGPHGKPEIDPASGRGLGA